MRWSRCREVCFVFVHRALTPCQFAPPELKWLSHSPKLPAPEPQSPNLVTSSSVWIPRRLWLLNTYRVWLRSHWDSSYPSFYLNHEGSRYKGVREQCFSPVWPPLIEVSVCWRSAGFRVSCHHAKDTAVPSIVGKDTQALQVLSHSYTVSTLFLCLLIKWLTVHCNSRKLVLWRVMSFDLRIFQT